MKYSLNIKLIAALAITLTMAACASCSQEPTGDTTEGNEKPEQKEPDEEGLKPGSFKFVASPLKGEWKAGDKIYVHGSLGSWAQTVTLETKDISADGKTATAYLGDVTERTVEPDLLYAAWPEESVKHGNGKIGAKTSFSECDRLLTAAYLKDDTFSFIDVSSSLTFSVSGDFDSYAIAAKDRNGIVVTNFEVEYTSKSKNFTQKQNTGYPFRYGTLKSGEEVQIWMPGNMTFKGGISIYFGKDGKWPAIYTTSEDLTLQPGKNTDLGTVATTFYDGPDPKMPQKGNVTKYTVKFNELSGICLSEGKDFLWAVGDDGDLAKLSFEGDVLYTFHIGGDSEAVSLHPETGDLLIGLEPDGVGIVKGPDFNTRASTLFSIAAAKNYGNAGIEGLTYYKDGKVYAGAQSNSAIFLCDLETKSVVWQKNIYNKDLVSEIADLFYDPLTDWLWIIDSEAKKIFVFDGEVNNLLGAYPIDGDNPESVCVDHIHSCVWVGDDYGSTSYLYRYDFTGLDDADIQ